MKKAKNITLLTGIICGVISAIWTILNLSVAVYYNFRAHPFSEWSKHYFNEVIPPLFVLLLNILPVVLLVRNLKGKQGIVLPILSIAVNAAVLLLGLHFEIINSLVDYRIYIYLGYIDSWTELIWPFIKNGGVLFVVGYTLMIVGSSMSFPRRNGKNKFDELINMARVEIFGLDETAEGLPAPQVTVLLTDNNRFYLAANDADGTICEKLKQENDTKVVKLLTMWKDGCVDVPSFAFRHALIQMDERNNKAEIILQKMGGGYSVKKLSVTFPQRCVK